jgi:hypothetical protein
MIKTSDKYKQKILIINNNKTQELKMNSNSDNFMETDVMEEPTKVVTSPSEKKTKRKGVMEIYRNTGKYDKLVPIGSIEQHRLNDIAYPPNDKELDDLYVLIEKSGLLDPIEVSEKDKKVIWSGHRRYRTLIKKAKVAVVPVKYVPVPEFDNEFEELTYLTERNVRRTESFIDKYNYLKYYFDNFKKRYKVELSSEQKEYQCKIKGVSLDLFTKARKIEYCGRNDLWKKIVDGTAVTTVYKQFMDGSKPKDRTMNRSIITYFDKNREILIEALSETSIYMNSLVNQERKDLEKNDGSTHNPFLSFQPNIIGGMVHEDLTKNIAAILRRNGKDVEALNDGLADITSLIEKWDLETKTTVFDGTRLSFTSSKGWGAYYVLLGYTYEFDRFFLALVRVPHKSWTFARGGLCLLSTKELHRISQKSPKDYIQILGGIGESKGKYHCYLDNLR